MSSHQPALGSSGEEATCADGDSPVKINTPVSRLALSSPHVSYAMTGLSGFPRAMSNVPGMVRCRRADPIESSVVAVALYSRRGGRALLCVRLKRSEYTQRRKSIVPGGARGLQSRWDA